MTESRRIARLASLALGGLVALSWGAAHLGVVRGLGAHAFEEAVLDYAPIWMTLTATGFILAAAPFNAWNEPNRNRAILLSLCSVVCGALILGQASQTIRYGSASLAWPSVPARLLEAEERTEGGDLVLAVRYAYTVDEQAYESNRVSFGGMIDVATPRLRRKTLDDVRVQPLFAHYDRAQPSLAVLEPGLRKSAWVDVGIGLLGLVGGIVALIPRRD